MTDRSFTWIDLLENFDPEGEEWWRAAQAFWTELGGTSFRSYEDHGTSMVSVHLEGMELELGKGNFQYVTAFLVNAVHSGLDLFKARAWLSTPLPN